MEETRVCPCKAMGESRREFCAAIASLGLGAAAVVPGAVAAFSGGFDPIMRGSAAGETPEFNLGALASLPEDGTPVKKAIIADKDYVRETLKSPPYVGARDFSKTTNACS